jgi:hypothetical protein
MRAAALALLCVSTWTMAACGESPSDPTAQLGPNPNLPEPQQSFFPKVRTASVIGWKKGRNAVGRTGAED